MIIEAARSWIGTPFRHQGRIKGVGVDCAGLAVGVDEECGLPVQDLDGYGRAPDARRTLAYIEAQCERIAAMEIGALLYMPHLKTLHLAIVTRLNPVYIIHAHSNYGVVEHRLDYKWGRRVKHIYRLPTWHN